MDQDPFKEYLIQSEPNKRDKGYVWSTAIGLQAVDGLKPSQYLVNTAIQNINGEISIEEAQKLLDDYYQENPRDTEERTEEADKVSVRIAQILSEKAFSFSPTEYISIHKKLFTGIYGHAGQIRDYNITKKEWVLNGETVMYGSASELRATLEYDLSREKSYSYKGLSMDEIICHLSVFVSQLWQIHIFGEGNTRTTAVFFIKYLRTLGFDVTNDVFATNAWYFRNSLVRANYTNLQKGIHETTEFLELFLRNLLLNEKHELHNREKHVNYIVNNYDKEAVDQFLNERCYFAIKNDYQMNRYIANGLTEYLGNQNIPWHMPGHKRKSIIDVDNSQTALTIDQILNLAMSMDITEVPGTDDLHHPEGIIRDSMEELKRIYGTYASYYLINGSTCGIMSAISACACRNKLNEDKYIIVARNCHMSVYNTVELLVLKPIYVEPKHTSSNSKDTLNIYGSINPDDVEKICQETNGITAMVITSPTYEGVISDISSISQILRKYNISLIVDEAHGAHLPFMENTPESAIQCGADIVVQSLHKTLPSLTQTAILHVMNSDLDEGIRKYLSVFQSSSPSYVLLCSMERAVAWMIEQDFSEYFNSLEAFRERISRLNNICIVDSNLSKNSGAYDYDETRLVIYAKVNGENGGKLISGSILADILKKYGSIVIEMSGNDYVVLISSVMDGADEFENLAETLERIDADISSGRLTVSDLKCNVQDAKMKEDEIRSLVGTKASDDIYVYPPGSYVLTPGELITEEVADTLIGYIRAGRSIKGRLFDI